MFTIEPPRSQSNYFFVVVEECFCKSFGPFEVLVIRICFGFRASDLVAAMRPCGFRVLRAGGEMMSVYLGDQKTFLKEHEYE
jgi:hypothetical protein